MRSDRLARNGQNDAYERGWREGWAAALATVEDQGLELVLQREQTLEAWTPVAHGSDDPEPNLSRRSEGCVCPFPDVPGYVREYCPVHDPHGTYHAVAAVADE